MSTLQGLAETARARINSSLGTMVLFSGEAGTGKFLAAQVLATQLSVPLVEVDATAAASSGVAGFAAAVWQIMRDAAPRQAVVIFRNVGPLLTAPTRSRRDAVPSAEALELFSRWSSYPGLVIFSSTLPARLTASDDGRFAAVVRFPFPEAPARELLWRLYLNAGAGIDEAELAFIARSFRLCGAAIRACCEAAVRSAGESGRRVERADVVRALEAHYADLLVSSYTEAALKALANARGHGPDRRVSADDADGEAASGEGSA